MTNYHTEFQNNQVKSFTILKLSKSTVIWIQFGISSFNCLEMAWKKVQTMLYTDIGILILELAVCKLSSLL